MKKSLLMASLLLAGTSVCAQNEYFMGVGISSGSWTPKANVIRNSTGATITETSESDRGGILSILGGTIIDNTHKIALGYSKYNTDADVTMNSIDFGYSYLIDQDSLKITNKKWKPYVGIGYTINTYKEDLTGLSSVTTTSEAKLTTKALMLGFGTDYEIDKKQFLTIGYDFSLSTSGDKSIPLTIAGNDYTLNMETEKVSRWLIAYNYKF